MIDINKIHEYIDGKNEEILKIQRYIHNNAEISFKEYETARYIKNFYEDNEKDIEWIRHPVGENGIAVKIKGSKSGKTIAIRADFDAVEISDRAIHACGHDAHTAILLITAETLLNIKDDLCGDVIIIHQHAEEVPPGGALSMIKDGVLNGVDAVIGGHIWNQYDCGSVYLKSGMVMAGRAYFKIRITGRGGHGSQPHLCNDPILIGSQFVTSVQSIVSRNIHPAEPAVITIGRFEGHGKFNVIPESVTLEGDARFFSDSTSDLIYTRIKNILDGYKTAYNCDYELIYQNDYPPVINDGNLVDFAYDTLEKYPIENLSAKTADILMGSEDFSYYQREVPGLYVFFGAKPDGEVFMHHHPEFTFNENCMIPAVKFYVNYAINYLNNKI